MGIQLDTVIIAPVTVVRVALGAIVESNISQGAWIGSPEPAGEGLITMLDWTTSSCSMKHREGCGEASAS
jgi:hypothetical protein